MNTKIIDNMNEIAKEKWKK